MQLFYKGHYPFLRILVAFLIGIFLANNFTISEKTSDSLCTCCIASAGLFFLFCLVLGWSRRNLYSIYGLLFLTSMLLAGWIKYVDDDPQINAEHFSRIKSSALIGYVAEDPIRTGNQLRFPMQISKRFSNKEFIKTNGKLWVILQVGNVQHRPQISYGDEFIFPALYKEVPPSYNPGEMDYKTFLRHQHIWHQSYFKENQVQKTGRKQGSWLTSTAIHYRETLVEKLNAAIKRPDAQSITAALLLGYRSQMERDLQNAYAVTGTIHILSVSGMHVAVIFWLLTKLMNWMGPRLKWLRYGLLIASIWSFTLLTGLAPSAIRAAIMLSFVITAIAFNKQVQIYNSIAASAFILLWLNPCYAFDIGFQLSYLAIWGIIFFYPKIKKMWQPTWRGWIWLWDYTAVSVAAQLGAFPLAMYYFHQFPLYFLPANLLVALPVTAIMWLGIVLLVNPFIWINHLAGWLLEKIIEFTNRSIYGIQALPNASLEGIWLDTWQYVSIYTLLLSLFLGIHYKYRKGYLLSMSLLCLLSATGALRNLTNYNLREVCIYNMRSNLAIGLYSSQQSLIYTDIPSLNDRHIRYSVWPESSRHGRFQKIIHLSENASWQNQDLIIRRGLIQFGHKRLMVYDGKHKFRKPLKIDILLLRKNPPRSLEDILKEIPCHHLLVDASNSPHTIKRLHQQAENLHISFYLLKNNFAYVYKF